MSLSLLLCMVKLATSSGVTSRNIPSIERQSLHDLYVSTNGDDWIYQDGDAGHWNFTDPDVNPCSSSDPWQGLNCTVTSSNTSSYYYYISEVILSEFNLRGSIPESIGNLSKLNYLDLSYNSVNGTLPNSIYQLSNLYMFYLDTNLLQGTLSHAIQQMFKLQYLDLHYNYFDGTIPSSIGNLSELTYLRLSVNAFSGKIPDSIRYLKSLNLFYISYNELTGTIPNWIGELNTLSYVSFQDNQLNGTIPSSLFELSNLIVLSLLDNQLTGTIPTWIGELKTLSYLSFQDNQLNGTIPSSLFELTNLIALGLSNNSLTGTISTWIGELKKLSYVDLEYNLLTGTIPYSLFELSNLNILALSYNPFAGTLPSVMVKMPYLYILAIEYTDITGTIPNCLTNLSSVVYLYIHNNKMSGTIPIFIGDFTYLQTLELRANRFNGSIPSSLSNLTSLIILYLDSNILTGTIPSSFNALTSLQEFDLQGNLLTGTIPDIFSNLMDMILINISSNYFTGSVPSSIAKLQHLEQFFIQDNLLSENLMNVFNGSLQKSLINVQLSNNQFTGQLPHQLFLSSSLVSVAAVSNCFHGSIPSSICMNDQLVSLALDGLVCASSCRKKIFAGISSSYISSHSINGGIPHCIWSMPNLQVLHMSGNSLTGTLPINLSDSIVDLSLSYNLFTGRISSSIQEISWSNLDLSHNRLSGTLVSGFNLSSNQSSLSLKDNRISGFIPSSIRDLISINILEGGYYDCKYDRSDLPSHDTYKDVYECGSETFNVIYYIWLGMIVITVLVLLVVWYYRDNINVSVLIGKIIQWLDVDTYLQALASSTGIDNNLRVKLDNMKYLKRYIATFEMMRVMSINLTLFIIIILLPIYTILGIYYRTHTYEYAWSVAMMYISGKAPFGIAISALLIFIFSQFLSYNTLRNKSNMKMIHEEIDHRQDLSDDNSISTTNRNHIWIVYIIYVMINLIIVAGVNIGYVLVVLYQSRSIIILTQILLSIFKCFWISYISPLMVRWIINHLKIDNISQQSTLFFLQFVVSIFNTIIIPCLVIMVISPNCFYHAFQPESDVTSKYSYSTCEFFNQNNVCTQYEIQNAVTSYNPPFSYSYQCGSEFITYYAPVFVLLCMLSTFMIPITQIIWIKMKLPNILEFGQLLNPILDHTEQKLININEIYELLVSELIFIGLMLTFGTIFPPLAVVLLFAISAKSHFHQILLGNFISNVVSSNIHSRLDMLEDNLKVQPLLSTIEKCGWFLLYTACTFYTLFLFDILGDSVGFYEAYWVLIVMPCLPLMIHVIYDLSKYIAKTRGEKQSEVSVNNDNNNHTTAVIQLTSTLSIVSNPLSFSSEYIRDSSMKDIDASDRSVESLTLDDFSL